MGRRAEATPRLDHRLADDNLTSITKTHAMESKPASAMQSSREETRRHQPVVPDKVPTGEYPVSHWNPQKRAMGGHS
jgi:hypothetical protein